jgi:hypothetical protein
MSAPELDVHPLFPVAAADDEPAEVGWIHVTRWDAGVQRWAPRLYSAAELVELAQVAEWYGGGAYELIARDRRKTRITDRRKYHLPGTPRPLSADDAPAPLAAAPMQAPAAPDPSTAVLATMMQLMTQIMAQQSQSQAQMMTAVVGALQSPRHDGTAELVRHALTQQADIFKLALAEKSDGTEAVVRGLELGSQFAAGAREAAEAAAGSGDDLATIVEGVKAFGSMAASSPNGKA